MEPPAAAASEQLARLRQLLEGGHYAALLESTRALLADEPENRDALYMLAVSLRRLKRVPEALAGLERLEQLHPKFSRLFQERGQCYVAQRNAELAIDAFERAVHLSAALPASWNALRSLSRMAGRDADANTAAAHVAKLSSLPPDIVTASALFADGQVHDAERIVRRFLLAHGDHIEAMRLLARIGIELDILDDLDNSVRSILDFCGLSFEPACLQFYKNERSVHTASSEQVRQPIYREGLEQWRRFEPWLGPLRTALGPLAGPRGFHST